MNRRWIVGEPHASPDAKVQPMGSMDPLHARDPIDEAVEDVASRRSREGTVWRMAFLVSFAIHVLIFLLGPVTHISISPFAAAGPDNADERAADGLVELVALSSAPPAPLQPPPVPVLDAVLPEPEILPPDVLLDVELEVPDVPEPGVGTTVGTDPEVVADAGIAGASGQGDAGIVDEGRSRLIPPSPRGMIMPPTNAGLRGREVEVWVFVGENGRVVPDSTQLRPPTSDRRFNEQLEREAAQWIFEPARQDGLPVAAWFPYRISME